MMEESEEYISEVDDWFRSGFCNWKQSSNGVRNINSNEDYNPEAHTSNFYYLNIPAKHVCDAMKEVTNAMFLVKKKSIPSSNYY